MGLKKMSFRINSARTTSRSPNANKYIVRPRTMHSPRTFSYTFAQRKPEKEELSQEKFVEQITDQLDKSISMAAGQKEIFKLHQDVFAKLISRFEMKNQAMTKVKKGYEDIIDKLQTMQKENRVYQMSMRNISSSVQNEIIALQEKIKSKRDSLNNLSATLDNLIDDLRKENAEHVKTIEKTKNENTQYDMMNLDAQANLYELSAKNQKKQQQYDSTKSNEDDLISQEEQIEKDIKDQKALTEVLIKELIDDNHTYKSLKQDVADLEAEKKALIEANNNLSSDIQKKTHEEDLLQAQLDALANEIDTIRKREDKYIFDLSKIARQMHVPNKQVQNASSSYVALLEACLPKYRF